MAAEYGMKLVYRKPFADFFSEHIRKGDGRGLIGRMQALEVGHSHNTHLVLIAFIVTLIGYGC